MYSELALYDLSVKQAKTPESDYKAILPIWKNSMIFNG